MNDPDPIVEEVRRARDSYAARFNYDPQAIFRDIQEQQRLSGLTFVSFSGKKAAPETTPKAIKPSCQEFPAGWDEARVKEVIAHYDNQTEDEEFAEIETARDAEGMTLMAVPTELVPEVRALLARKQSA